MANVRIGVIGLGYVGLPLCHALHEGGLAVVGFDVDPEKVADLTAGRCYLDHFGKERTASGNEQNGPLRCAGSASARVEWLCREHGIQLRVPGTYE